MNLIKCLGFVAVVASAATVVVVKQMEKEKRNKELDEFLLYDESEPVVVDLKEEDDAMKGDIASWLEKEEDSAVLIFSLKNREKTVEFQDELSKVGLSSNIDTKDSKVEVLYNDEMNQESLNTLIVDLENILEKINAKYEGYHFTR